MRVIAALSGGVDSAVAAARAVDAGHEVVGIHLALARAAQRSGTSKGCCSPADAQDARRVADMLDIPFYVWDLSDEFTERVVDDFVDEYRAGRTPNPCLRCNESIKFTAVLERAQALGFDAVCTGHYARIVQGPAGPELHRAVDPSKDQSYVLSVLSPQQISGTLLPLGESLKADVRADAAARGLRVADKPDSHDICFIPDGDTAGWLRERLGEEPGDIVDKQTGHVVGRHRGTHSFTVGQRRGLAVSVPAPSGARRYVVDVDASSATVWIGEDALLSMSVIEAQQPRWCGTPPDAGTRVDVQIRAHGSTEQGIVEVQDDVVTVRLDHAVRGVAPGQAMALYEGTRVIGSATIERARP
jgi:tRNA-uridine 2-sulfurtransferase